jgi:hypothetical protein
MMQNRRFEELCQELGNNRPSRTVVDIKYLDMDNDMASLLGQGLVHNTVVTSISLRLSGLTTATDEHENNPQDEGQGTTAFMFDLLLFISSSRTLKEVTLHGTYFSETADASVVNQFVRAVGRNPIIQSVTLERIHCLQAPALSGLLLAPDKDKEETTTISLKHLELLCCNVHVEQHDDSTNSARIQPPQWSLASAFGACCCLKSLKISYLRAFVLMPIWYN